MVKRGFLRDFTNAEKVALKAKYGSAWNVKVKKTDFIFNYGTNTQQLRAATVISRNAVEVSANAPAPQSPERIVTFSGVVTQTPVDGFSSKIHISIPIRSSQIRSKIRNALLGHRDAIWALLASADTTISGSLNISTAISYSDSLRLTKPRYTEHTHQLAGPAFEANASNCVINALEQATGKFFPKLHAQYKDGVYPPDYQDIVVEINKQVKKRIVVSYGPNNELATHVTYQATKAKYGSIFIRHYSNHATVITDAKLNSTYRVVDEVELVAAMKARANSLFRCGDTYAMFRLPTTEESYETLRLATDDGVELTDTNLTAQSVLLKDFTSQFDKFPFEHPNLKAYDSFAKHGIHFSLGNELPTDIDIDLIKAYDSYHKLPSYRGLPRDITTFVDTITIDQVKSHHGFAHVLFECPIRQRNVRCWASFPLVEILHDNELLLELNEGAIAISSFDLDTTSFYKDGYGKRVFQRVLGSSTSTFTKKSFITTDQFELDGRSSHSVLLPSFFPEGDTTFANHHQFTHAMPSESDRASHITAYAQDYVFAELISMTLYLQTLNPGLRIKTALVDGLRVPAGTRLCEPCFPTNNVTSPHWLVKPIKKSDTSAIDDEWDFQNVEFATNEYIPLDFGMDIVETAKPLFRDVYSDNCLSFEDMVKQGYCHFLRGAAGTGKSWIIKQICRQSSALILTPTHAVREMYEAEKFDVMTYQLAAQRIGALSNKYNVVVVDEASMLTAMDLNRLAQICGRKHLILVGDEYQHKPVLQRYGTLEAKSLYFNEHLSQAYVKGSLDESLSKKIQKMSKTFQCGSDYERTLQLTRLQYDDDLEKQKNKSEVEKQAAEAIRGPILDERRERINKLGEIIRHDFPALPTYAIDAFSCLEGGKILTEIKRTSDPMLVALSNAVRIDGVETITAFIDESKPKLYENTLVLAMRNADVNFHNAGQTGDVMVDDVPIDDVLRPVVLRASLNLTPIEGKRVTIYNGSAGTIKDGIINFESHPDLTFQFDKDHKHLINSLKLAYAATSYFVQGRSIADTNIIIDCSCVSREMLYVAITRARKLDQIHFINWTKDSQTINTRPLKFHNTSFPIGDFSPYRSFATSFYSDKFAANSMKSHPILNACKECSMEQIDAYIEKMKTPKDVPVCDADDDDDVLSAQVAHKTAAFKFDMDELDMDIDEEVEEEIHYSDDDLDYEQMRDVDEYVLEIEYENLLWELHCKTLVELKAKTKLV